MERIELIVNRYKKFSSGPTNIEINVKFKYRAKRNKEKGVTSYPPLFSIIYMDSGTQRGYVLNNFRLGILISILYYKKLISFRYQHIEKQI